MPLDKHSRTEKGTLRRERSNSTAGTLRKDYPEFSNIRSDAQLGNIKKISVFRLMPESIKCVKHYVIANNRSILMPITLRQLMAQVEQVQEPPVKSAERRPARRDK